MLCAWLTRPRPSSALGPFSVPETALTWFIKAFSWLIAALLLPFCKAFSAALSFAFREFATPSDASLNSTSPVSPSIRSSGVPQPMPVFRVAPCVAPCPVVSSYSLLFLSISDKILCLSAHLSNGSIRPVQLDMHSHFRATPASLLKP